MSDADDQKNKGLKLISYVTRRLVEGHKGEFIKIYNEQFNVVINMRGGNNARNDNASRGSNDTHITIRGSEDNVRAASEFLQRMDQKAELFANERKLTTTGQVHHKEWEHMRVELNHALKKLKPSYTPSTPPNSLLVSSPDKHLSDVFDNNAQIEKAQKERAPEARKGKTASGFYPKNLSQAVGILAVRDPDVSIVILEGSSGCGKTHLAVSHAIDVHNSSDYGKILMFRPRTAAGKGEMGAMPGGPEEKMDFYTKPFANKVKEITGKSITEFNKMERLTPDGERGESRLRTLVIIDEAQNLSMSEAKLLITRMGHGSKFIICGDISSNQNDIGAEMPGLAYLIATQAAKANRGVTKLQEGMAFISFTESDTESRHPMMPSIVDAFNNPVDELKEKLDKITSFRRNAQLIQAIEETVVFAQAELKTAADATLSRYEQAAKNEFPSLFGVDNVRHLPLPALKPEQKLG